MIDGCKRDILASFPSQKSAEQTGFLYMKSTNRAILSDKQGRTIWQPMDHSIKASLSY